MLTDGRMNGQTDKQTDRQTDRLTARQTNRERQAMVILKDPRKTGYKKKDKQKLRQKCQMVLYFLRNAVQNGPKTPKNIQSRSPNTFFSLVTTTVSI